MYKVYLAGPEVFLPEELCNQVSKAKKEICNKHNLSGLFPTDLLAKDVFSGEYTKQKQAQLIRAACIDAMQQADAVIANITPFRGASADVGTIFEVGYMDGLGKPVFLYSNCTKSYKDKVGADPLNMIVEDFDLVDNLMFGLQGVFQGADYSDKNLQGYDRFTSVETFQQAVTRLQKYIQQPK